MFLLIISNFEHLFTCLFTICISSLEKYLFRSYAYFSSYAHFLIAMTFFTKLEKIILKCHIDSQKIQNCQSTPEAKEQHWRHTPSRLKTMLQSYSNKNSMVLAQKQTSASMEQITQPRNKPICI